MLGDAQDVVSLAQDEVAEQAELARGVQERSRHAAQRSQASEDRRAAVADLAAADAEIAALRTALAQRAIIGQAVGIIMATERVDAQEAFSRLVRKSQSANVKVRDLAPQLVAQATRSWTADDRHS